MQIKKILINVIYFQYSLNGLQKVYKIYIVKIITGNNNKIINVLHIYNTKSS